MRFFLRFFCFLVLGFVLSTEQKVFAQTSSTSSAISSCVTNGSASGSEYVYLLSYITMSCSGGNDCYNQEITVEASDASNLFYTTEVTAYCGSCSNCISCAGSSSCLNVGASQDLEFSEDGAYIVLNYCLYLSEGGNVYAVADENDYATTMSITVQYGGTPPEGSTGNGSFFASVTSENLPSGASFALTASGTGFSLAYVPSS
ncbi:MAG: hypothetical protein K2Y01_06785 [Rhabdochlamydiaceae bacterium]|nr:hypothetical protein [Rhabdochlamydiaceae bacterium]